MNCILYFIFNAIIMMSFKLAYINAQIIEYHFSNQNASIFKFFATMYKFFIFTVNLFNYFNYIIIYPHLKSF